MDEKWAVYGRLREWLGDVLAKSEQEAMIKAKAEHPYAEIVLKVVPGNDLGCNGL